MNSTIDFDIYYRTGKSNIKADALSRDLALKDYNYSSKNYNIVDIAALQQVTFNNNFADSGKQQYTKEELISLCSKIGNTDIYKEDNLFFISNRLCLPKSVYDKIIQKEHSTTYWGRDKSIEIINWNFYINDLYNKVATIIAKCDKCQ